ncbi:hypothetical protein CFP56_036562 [Quercus suber]|uniref:RNase H type-1 domain-containing protein n=1 Tax=Quercus suber TaxID=58331 RepID=A0AAW0J6X2_QUESU
MEAYALSFLLYKEGFKQVTKQCTVRFFKRTIILFVCPYTVRASNSEQRQEEERGSFGREDSETSGRESRTVDEPGEEAREEFGPWMLVTRRKVGPNVSKSRFLASMTGRGADTSAFGSREGQVPRANHQPYKNDIKSHRGAFEGNGKKGRQVLSNCALEKSGVYSQDTANFGAEPTHASPSCQSLDHAFSFVTWAGSHPSSAGIKGSVCCPSKGVKSGSASDVRKSSRKGKSLASPHGRRKQTPVGNFSAGESNGIIRGDDDTNKSQPNDGVGVVRSIRDGSVEPHFSFDTGKPKVRDAPAKRPSMDGVDKALVGLPLEQANRSRGQDSWVESAITSVSGAKFESLKQLRRSRGKENNERRVCCGGLQREYEEHITSASGCPTPTTQPSDKLKGIPIGDTRACNNLGGRGGVSRKVLREMGWKADLLLQLPQAKVVHCYREANFCADALAKLGASSSDGTSRGSRSCLSQKEAGSKNKCKCKNFSWMDRANLIKSVAICPP